MGKKIKLFFNVNKDFNKERDIQSYWMGRFNVEKVSVLPITPLINPMQSQLNLHRFQKLDKVNFIHLEVKILRNSQDYFFFDSGHPNGCEVISHCGVFFFVFNVFILLIYFFWLCWVFTAVHGLSLVAVSRGYSSLRCAGFSLRWLLLLHSKGSRHVGFSSCSMQAQQLWLTGSRAQAQQLWHTGLAAPRHVGSSRTRARTRIPCTGRWILNHCANREVHQDDF